MLKQIKSITRKDIDSDEIKQREYIKKTDLWKDLPIEKQSQNAWREPVRVPVCINSYATRTPLICSQMMHYLRMEYNFSVLFIRTDRGSVEIFILSRNFLLSSLICGKLLIWFRARTIFLSITKRKNIAALKFSTPILVS
jgi:hypothetical protein